MRRGLREARSARSFERDDGKIVMMDGPVSPRVREQHGLIDNQSNRLLCIIDVNFVFLRSG